MIRTLAIVDVLLIAVVVAANSPVLALVLSAAHLAFVIGLAAKVAWEFRR